MTTKFVKFPPAAQVAAQAYCDECTNQQFAATAGMETLWYVPREDRNGNWTVALYGPPYQYGMPLVEVAEPASCAALRADAVVVDTPEWPDPEE